MLSLIEIRKRPALLVRTNNLKKCVLIFRAVLSSCLCEVYNSWVMNCLRRQSILFLSMSLCCSVVSVVWADTEGRVDFATAIQPILRKHCYECHAGEVREGELNLGVKREALQGGESGPAIVPGESDASLLVRLITGREADRVMPPEDKTPLTKQQIQVVKRWIDQGADWPDHLDVKDPRFEQAQKHWAFEPLQKVTPPEMAANDHWSRTDIDGFVKRKLDAAGLAPSPVASGQTLVRRLYFDLVGLPPTPEQSAAFLEHHQKTPLQATDALVDELLNSPQYGERWARHWLDVARYADSNGQELDDDRPHAFHFRDFVIQAFNADMPYDQFVRWQIAGDEYEPSSDAAVSATGFLAAGTSFKLEDTFLERERLFNRYNELDDIINTVGTGFLGLTFGCARCHDHKYDAFSSKEYYQLLRVFHSGDRTTAKLPSGKEAFVYQDFDAHPRTTWLFRRSDFYDREIEVELAFPAIMSRGRDALAYWNDAKSHVDKAVSTLQRRAFAEWLTDVEHGAGALLARVFVNRVWQHHFGHGLVRTPTDFGVRGDAPTHPELLEFLAADYVEHGWRLKRLHRMILTSAVWQQTSGKQVDSADVTDARTVQAQKVDPQNRLLWTMRPQRLEAEALRDAMLAVSGTLNLEAGGPGFKPPIPPEANLARNIKDGGYPKDAQDNASTRRRSIYMFHKRLIPYPLFQAFDRPSLMVSCGRRQNTTVAPQAMAILNGQFVRSVARDFAKRLLATAGGDDQRLIRDSFARAFARPPTAGEVEASADFLRAQTLARAQRQETNPRLEAIADYCHSLFGLNEFIYVD